MLDSPLKTDSILSLAPFDLAILGGYILFLLWTAYATRHEAARGEVDYLLAGRRLTLPAFVATLVSTWYGGILGVGEYSFLYGISNWLVFGVPYYLAALIFALFLARLARRSRLYSIPDQLERAYGRGPALVGASVVFLMTVPAAYVLMAGVLLKMIFGGPLLLWIIVGTLFSTLYVAAGGFKSVVRTDLLQFVAMYVGFFLLVFLAFQKYGGLDFLSRNLPEGHLSWDGGRPASAIVVWYFIAMATLVEPSFYQRCYAARSERVARGGILVSILFWVVFDLFTTISGMYARAVLPADINPMASYPALADLILPTGIKGIFVLALLATIMSTVDSYSFLAAQTLGRDLISRARGKIDRWQAGRIQVGLAVSALLAILIAAWSGSAIRIWHDLGSIGTPMLLLPMAASFSDKPVFPRRWVLASMLLAGCASLLWTISGYTSFGYPLGIEPIYIGIGVSLASFIIARATSKIQM